SGVCPEGHHHRGPPDGGGRRNIAGRRWGRNDVMKDSDQNAKPVPKEKMTARERWELPLLDERGNQVVQEEEVKPSTAADLQEIREAAREDGYQEGREAGYQEGFTQGRNDGHKEGSAAGEAEGREQGRELAEEATRQEVASRMTRLEHLLGELLLPI